MIASRRVCPLPLLLIALLVLLMLAAGLISGVRQVEAQTSSVLVSNMDQGGDTVIGVNAALSKVAQRFTTGPEAVGFTLGSVGFFSTVLEEDHDTAGDYLSVTLNAVGSGNNPGDALCTLSDPLSFSGNAVNTFAAPASCPALAANTDYFVVIDRVVLEQRDIITLSETSSSSQDDGGAAGWSINDNIHFFKNSWATPSKARVLQVEIKGVVTTRPSAPGHLSARVASSTQIDLAWDAPTNQGASAITGYEVGGIDRQRLHLERPRRRYRRHGYRLRTHRPVVG